jgi:hypothetical protein
LIGSESGFPSPTTLAALAVLAVNFSGRESRAAYFIATIEVAAACDYKKGLMM